MRFNFRWSMLAKFLSTPSARRATRRARFDGIDGKVFLSTPSARRATWRPRKPFGFTANFYPRPPRGGRRCVPGIPGMRGEISIHALREEGDPEGGGAEWQSVNFYPRPPRGGRPCLLQGSNRWNYFYPRPPRGGRRNLTTIRSRLFLISIHALREEGDWAQQSTGCTERYFYPRPPRGGRRPQKT